MIKHFEHGNAIEIHACKQIIFNFYMRLSHILIPGIIYIFKAGATEMISVRYLLLCSCKPMRTCFEGNSSRHFNSFAMQCKMQSSIYRDTIRKELALMHIIIAKRIILTNCQRILCLWVLASPTDKHSWQAIKKYPKLQSKMILLDIFS